MLVLLPPSETKASGGDGPPLRLDTLSHPELTPTRRKLVDELVRLAGDAPAGRIALGLSERQVGELARNAALWNALTLPALHRYTGVLYTALDTSSLRASSAARLAVASALFGLLAADDPIPAYRLSGGAHRRAHPGSHRAGLTGREFGCPPPACRATLYVTMTAGARHAGPHSGRRWQAMAASGVQLDLTFPSRHPPG